MGRIPTVIREYQMIAKKEKELEEQVFCIGLICLAVGTGGWIIFYISPLRSLLPDIPCPFSTVMGIYCPGCGGTRAVRALLEGRLLASLWYHPLVPYAAVIGGGFMATQGLARLGIKHVKGWKFHNWYLYGAILLIGCNFLIKNMLRLIWGVTM